MRADVLEAELDAELFEAEEVGERIVRSGGAGSRRQV